MSKRPVNDPMLRSIVNAQLSRRKLLMGAGGLSLAGMLAACGTGGGTSGGASSKPSAAADLSDSEKVVNWANWTLYLDYDDSTQKYPSLEAFSAATGIEANYSEDVDGNDSYFGKVQAQLSSGQDIGQDIVTLTDWMAARLIRLGYTQELDLANIPNSKNLLPNLKNVDFDPGRKHSLTWQSGFGGIVWNKEAFPKGLKSVSDLWQPELKGRVEVLDEMLDTMGLLMMDNGVDITGDWGEDEFENALDVLSKQIADGQIRQVKGNSYKEDLISGDALAVIGWSGDITQLNFEEGDKWEFAIPEAGGTLWSDNMLVPIGSPHKANAERLMDYYFDPVNAATVAAYVNYICPVEGAREAMESIDPELVENPLIFPTDEYLANAHVIRTLTPDEETDFNDRFQTAIGN
ncbi:spermidine/putrescine ABC transporter substrate-binding protein [Arthrobacter sp. zg-Y916]|uniref:Spermidine/putrescine ABC transporter substrate-binding protein n=1 Tax=Arthrobacter caoxuetaonis TaxID=2886935 RepID=A0A9X1SCC5_9MICC|nr:MULTISPECIES: spermidine/putrescine ABC transporter substrate-binding protein [Arthrobacter]MCC3297417.1 spermidine/putrescine ABC transporter substrate-binding protein [Arthrobacter caoxuetaonis]MCC9194312.1 spermidine/putrescine ABC transporter substrate-binding protein [Arthrobacter sp. zg-Y916]USQ58050.1 spermidine/putrescine ABC transporter substrate-binding protein [Arthrobacter caoxuetaonis]